MFPSVTGRRAKATGGPSVRHRFCFSVRRSAARTIR
jgi:hypothetical protein